MTIKLFSNSCMNDLERDVNAFLADVSPTRIVDIKMTESNTYNSIMVILRG